MLWIVIPDLIRYPVSSLVMLNLIEHPKKLKKWIPAFAGMTEKRNALDRHTTLDAVSRKKDCDNQQIKALDTGFRRYDGKKIKALDTGFRRYDGKKKCFGSSYRT